MRSVLRHIAGVIVGIILCMPIIMVLEMAGHAVLSGQALFMAPVAAYLIAVGTGGYVAIRIAGVRRWWLPGIIAAFLGAGVLYNLTILDHPVWFLPAALVALVAGWVLCWRLTTPAAP